ncbi:MAG: hypothetical protein CMN36_04595 [SAR116 cluster bacterium]|nr:hypothetical protein [SAR116 cluster bacterium]
MNDGGSCSDATPAFHAITLITKPRNPSRQMPIAGHMGVTESKLCRASSVTIAKMARPTATTRNSLIT